MLGMTRYAFRLREREGHQHSIPAFLSQPPYILLSDYPYHHTSHTYNMRPTQMLMGGGGQKPGK
jgi:hypothetical protein